MEEEVPPPPNLTARHRKHDLQCGPRHRKCPRHDLHDRSAECDPWCINPARYYEGLAPTEPMDAVGEAP